MCQVVAIAAVIISVYIPALAQGMLPPADGALILAVKSSRQASAIAPYELKLLSGTQITVSAVDVDGPATELVRSAMAKQSRQVVKPSHLFVLRIQRAAEVGKSRTEVVLLSGATVQVATPDVRDPRLTFLRTELAQAAALQRHVPIPEGPELSVEERYVRTVHLQMMLKWQEPEGAAGVVTLRVVVKRDGRITDIAVEKSGGETLDAAVIRGIRAVGQLPPFPAGLLKDELTFRIILRGPSFLPRSRNVSSPTTPDRFNAIDRTNGLGMEIPNTTPAAFALDKPLTAEQLAGSIGTMQREPPTGYVIERAGQVRVGDRLWLWHASRIPAFDATNAPAYKDRLNEFPYGSSRH